MKNKGSTLLLGMVIVSIVLAAGVGVSTILLRQLRGVGDKSAAAISYYIAETAAEKLERGIVEEESEESVDWEGVDREITYKGEEEEGAYLITVNIGDSYYSFVKEIEDVTPVGPQANVHFQNTEEWDDVVMHYALFHEDGTEIEKKDMTESEKGDGYMKSTITLLEDTNRIGHYFCEGEADEIDNCWDEGVESTGQHDMVLDKGDLLVHPEECFDYDECGQNDTPPFILFVRE